MQLNRTWPLAVCTALAVVAAGALLWHGLTPDDAQAPTAAEAAEASRGNGGSMWGADYFPNVPLVTHDGQRVRFYDDMIAGKVVLINFIYTSCPDTCPMETARLLEVARLLGDRLGDDVFFYSLTVDPGYDSQEVLADFAANWGIPEGWKFVTGDPDDLVRVRTKLGVDIDDVESLKLSQHPISLVMGNQATGRWMKRSPFENSYVIADQLGRWLHNWKLPSTEERDYENAPEIRQISSGEDLFRTRCAACHTIGRGEVRELAERRIGPDLYKVGELRDRAWLERWLAEPDRMLAEKDPLAMALYAEYDEIPMPNLRLSESDVDKLLGYMDQESRRIAALRAGELGGHERHGEHGGHDGHGGHGGHGEHEEHAERPAGTAPDGALPDHGRRR